MTKISVLGISGSPRRNANTETLVDAFLEGAKDGNAEIEKIVLNELKIQPCQACDQCDESKECIYDDDMKEIVEKMKKNQIWVFGTPIYWWGPTGQFKVFMDRWISIPRGIFKDKIVVLIITLGAGSEFYARHTIAIFEDALTYVSAKLEHKIVVPSMSKTDDIQKKPDVIKKVKEIGKEIVRK